MRKPSKVLIIVIVAFLFSSVSLAEEKHSIYINRKAKTLSLLDSKGKIVKEFSCGIGRGGLKKKRSMSDYITPTGEFEIDLILYNDNLSRVASENVERYEKGQFGKYVETKYGLKKLFNNMNGIDFNGDSLPDKAYGTAYIGLNSKEAVTGPKMKRYKGTPYWYSIAIHGTPKETNVGRAASGGCIHLKEVDLKYLLDNSYIFLGMKVVIVDEKI